MHESWSFAMKSIHTMKFRMKNCKTSRVWSFWKIVKKKVLNFSLTVFLFLLFFNEKQVGFLFVGKLDWFCFFLVSLNLLVELIIHKELFTEVIHINDYSIGRIIRYQVNLPSHNIPKKSEVVGKLAKV